MKHLCLSCKKTKFRSVNITCVRWQCTPELKQKQHCTSTVMSQCQSVWKQLIKSRRKYSEMFPKQQLVTTVDAINYTQMQTTLYYFICNAVYFYTQHSVLCMVYWIKFILKCSSCIGQSIGASIKTFHTNILTRYLTVFPSRSIATLSIHILLLQALAQHYYFPSLPSCINHRRYNWICINKYNIRKLTEY
jgi:hypothetical protein